MTTDTKRLEELAARCEAATGPDRELDCELAKVGGWVEVKHRFDIRSCVEPDGRKHPHGLIAWAPKFTASLDAAMQLVPDGWGTSLHANTSDQSRALVYNADNAGRFSYGATPALALCSAALRSRSTTGG